ncbi:MAG: SRPBCC domain-containing protein [Tepidisphaeraceae bacterium]
MSEVIRTIRIAKTQSINAPTDIVWEVLLDEVGPGLSDPSMKSLNLKIEPHVGGRWYRDLGDGVGHLWGHVQVIKPGKLLELCGPMFMSYAATNHIQYKLTPDAGGTRLDFLHTGVGLIPEQDAKGVEGGWTQIADRIRKAAEVRAAK